MKFIKILFAILVALAILPLLIPSHYEIERSTHIQASPEEVFSYLVNLESLPEWGPWFEQEPSAERMFSGIPGVVGSAIEWKGQKIGAGKQTLISVQEPEYIELKLEFYEPQTSSATSYFILEPDSPGVKVTWGVSGERSYPFERVIGFLLKGQIADNFDKGLQNLKSHLDKPSTPESDEQ